MCFIMAIKVEVRNTDNWKTVYGVTEYRKRIYGERFTENDGVAHTLTVLLITDTRLTATRQLMQQLIQPLPRGVARAAYLDEARHNKNREENPE